MRGGRRAPEGASVITIRVSRDNGRTYIETAALAAPHEAPADPLAELLAAPWPPCQCPAHRAVSGKTDTPRLPGPR
ncbi:hypothetical protein ABZT02_44880 [Streptomyces sp. NPDC005402]|uniref:hypothetical protein n=1 Tax=Streptomyces sp. NPDC005402 TaxID=3155338 RepID=UPI00339F2204